MVLTCRGRGSKGTTPAYDHLELRCGLLAEALHQRAQAGAGVGVEEVCVSRTELRANTESTRVQR